MTETVKSVASFAHEVIIWYVHDVAISKHSYNQLVIWQNGVEDHRGQYWSSVQKISWQTTILCLKNNRYKAESRSESGKYYDINYLDDWSCTCTYHAKRHTDCKHIIAVQMVVMKVESLEPANFTIRKPVQVSEGGMRIHKL